MEYSIVWTSGSEVIGAGGGAGRGGGKRGGKKEL